VWREATIPLYHCRCRICERATLKANVASGMIADQALTIAPPPLQKALDVEIKQTTEVSAEEEEEDDLTSITESTTDMVITSKKRPSADLDADGETVETDEEVTRGGTPPKRARTTGSYSPTTIEDSSPRMRKRSSEELEEGLEVPTEQASKKRMRTSPSSTYAESDSIAEEGTTSDGGSVGENPRLTLRVSAPSYPHFF